ncbi:MAG: DUF3788 domain-containing protein [Tannerella sp.]|jgi:hypothetical protein|nr:DUF3788 domain-containing protein [Tannerella sp.]
MLNNRPLLNDPSIFPTDDILENILGESFAVLKELSTILTGEQGAVMSWKYYNDGKAWLCNVSCKKKTVFWLSIWDGYFKTGFYFLERHLEGIAALNIKENSFIIQKEWGKMIPVSFEISNREQLTDLLKMIDFKKKSK